MNISPEDVIKRWLLDSGHITVDSVDDSLTFSTYPLIDESVVLNVYGNCPSFYVPFGIAQINEVISLAVEMGAGK